MKDPKMRWKAILVFAPASTDSSLAELEIRDGEGSEIRRGVFEVAGCRIQVKEGRGAVRCGDFVKGRHEPAIWLHRKDVPPVPGALTFE